MFCEREIDKIHNKYDLNEEPIITINKEKAWVCGKKVELQTLFCCLFKSLEENGVIDYEFLEKLKRF